MARKKDTLFRKWLKRQVKRSDLARAIISRGDVCDSAVQLSMLDASFYGCTLEDKLELIDRYGKEITL